ncbi:MAG: membrane dipeptidase [Myxococcaceae bacterium]|nr:membrane dipeptidase [Myxococcaceae bacterium]
MCGWQRAAALLLVAGCATTPDAPNLSAPARFGADVHVHFALGRALPFFQQPGLPTSASQTTGEQFDEATLHRAGNRLLIGVAWPALATRAGIDARGETLRAVAALQRDVKERRGFALVYTPAQAARVTKAGLIAVIPGVEGAEAIASVEDVDWLYSIGVRAVGLVHFTDNAIADAEDGQFTSLLNGRDGGLTALGRDAVKRMVALGMVIDVAHSSDRTVRDVLDVTEPLGAPILSSHVGSGMALGRTLEDASAERIAKGKGLIGIGLYRSRFLVPLPQEDRLPNHVLGTCDDPIGHWLHYGKRVGFEAVLLGSDLSSLITRPAPSKACPNGIRHAGDVAAFYDALVSHGVPRERLDDAGERLLRFWQRVQSKASAVQPRRQTPSPVNAFNVPL